MKSSRDKEVQRSRKKPEALLINNDVYRWFAHRNHFLSTFCSNKKCVFFRRSRFPLLPPAARVSRCCWTVARGRSGSSADSTEKTWTKFCPRSRPSLSLTCTPTTTQWAAIIHKQCWCLIKERLDIKWAASEHRLVSGAADDPVREEKSSGVLKERWSKWWLNKN